MIKPEFESSYCDFCGSLRSCVVLEGPDRLLGLPGWFRVVRCVDCGLLRQDPRPTAQTMISYYPPEYEPYSIAIDDEPSFLKKWDRRYGMLKRRRAIERYCSGGRLLDVGCATGNFMYEMARSGNWEVEGVEPNAEAARYVQERFGFRVHIGDLLSVNLPENYYDVVTMWDVFEHLHYPKANLETVARILKPGGWFVFSIPNLRSLDLKLMGKYWIGWELPRHLYYPSMELMESMLGRFGLYIREWKCLSGAYVAFLLSLRFWLEDAIGKTFLTRFLISIAGSLIVRTVTSPLFYLITILNKGSIITGFAQLQNKIGGHHE